MTERRPEDDSNTAQWRRILLGTDPHLPMLRRRWGMLPSGPRCKLCAAPTRGIGSLLTRLIQHGTSPSNPLLCNLCFSGLRNQPGGAEIPLSILFADIRGSTSLAERTSASAFTRLVQRFYLGAARAVEDHGGVVDKFLGDGVMALFVPVIAGEAHAERAIAAGRAVLEASEEPALVAGGVRVGVGVHTGEAYVGTIGTGDRLDFSALGDAVNVAARLGSAAGPGELLVSVAAWTSGAPGLAAPEVRSMAITGRSAPLEVVVIRASGTAPPASVATGPPGAVA